MKLPGLSEQQTSDLKFSVNPITGYPRPLSPIEVMELIQVLVDNGLNKKDISEKLDTELSNVTNYYDRMKKLIPEVQELVGWNQTDKKQLKLGYSSVWHYSRLGDNGQLWIYKKHLENNCTRDEIRDTAQLFDRGFGNLEACFNEILDRRTKKEELTLITGKITKDIVEANLKNISQAKRDNILSDILTNLFSIDSHIKSTLTPKKFYILINPNHEKQAYSKIISNGFEEKITELIGEKFE